jgi:hypothetical protein
LLVSLAGVNCAPPARQAPAAEEPVRPIEAVRSSLHAIASAEERYYSDHGTYTTDVAALLEYPGCDIKPAVSITIHTASADGWAASGTHPGFPGRSCVQWVSRPGAIPVPVTRQDGRRGDELPGGVVCDAPPP